MAGYSQGHLITAMFTFNSALIPVFNFFLIGIFTGELLEMVRDNMLNFKRILCLRIHAIAAVGCNTGLLLDIAGDACKHIRDVLSGKAV